MEELKEEFRHSVLAAGVATSGSGLLTKVTRTDPALIQYAVQAFGTSNLSEDDWRKAEDHYKVMFVYICFVRGLSSAVLLYSFIHSLVFSLEGRAWQEPEPSHVTCVALAHCILGKFLGVVCHCFPPPLDFPTLAARCLRPQRPERS